MSSTVAERLEQVSAEFADCEPRERLELLLEYAENLPPLPPEYQAERDAGMNRVHECQTPVFLWVDVVGGRTRIVADVAPEAPTVKGFVGILVETFNGAPAEEVLATDPNLVQKFGLLEALGMMRVRGLGAIASVIRRRVQKAVAKASN
jgi:cysteine desulfuration protein SufE